MSDTGYVSKEFLDSLAPEEMVVLIHMGKELLEKACILNNVGHTSIAGHCYYVKEHSPCLIDQILLRLNGNKEADKKVSEFVLSVEMKPLIDKVMNDKFCRLGAFEN